MLFPVMKDRSPGIGIDMVKVSRLQKVLETRGGTFLKKVFTDNEIAYCEARKVRKYEHYAGRFAAKEAFFKAARPPVAIKFKEIEVRNDESGAPALDVSEKEKRRLGITDDILVSLSITHDEDYAMAVVSLQRA